MYRLRENWEIDLTICYTAPRFNPQFLYNFPEIEGTFPVLFCMACFSYLNRAYPQIGYSVYRQAFGIYRQALLRYQKYATAQYLHAYADSLSNDRMPYLQLASYPSERVGNLFQALYNSAGTRGFHNCIKCRATHGLFLINEIRAINVLIHYITPQYFDLVSQSRFRTKTKYKMLLIMLLIASFCISFTFEKTALTSEAEILL